MYRGYLVSVQTPDSTALVQRERKPLNSFQCNQWLSNQLDLAEEGQNLVLRTIMLYGTFADTNARTTASNYSGAPAGAIWYQIDNATYWQSVIAGAAPTSYTFPTLDPLGKPVVAVAKAKHALAPGNPTSYQGSDGRFWVGGSPEGFTLANTSPPTGFSNTAPAASDYNTWATTQTTPIPPINVFTYTIGPNQSSGTLTMAFKGFTANAAVKLTVYLYRTSFSSWQGQAVKVAINGTAVADWIYPSTAFAVYTVTANADSTGAFTVVMGARSGVTSAEVRISAMKVEEQ